MTKVKIEIVKILEAGTCPYEHKVGDTFMYPEDRGKICAAAFSDLYSHIRVLQFGGSFPWSEEEGTATVCCHDYKNPVVFKLTRVEEE